MLNTLYNFNGTSADNYSIEKNIVFNNHYFILSAVNDSIDLKETSTKPFKDENGNEIDVDKRTTYYNDVENKIANEVYNSIFGVLNEIPEISIKTEWGEFAAAKVDNAVRKFTENDLIDLFAKLNQNYTEPVATDQWTQKIPKESSLLNIELKFRAYQTKMYDTQDYKTIIETLLLGTTPKKYNLGDNILKIMNAVGASNAGGKQIVELHNNITSKMDDLKKANDNNNKKNNILNDLNDLFKKLSDLVSNLINSYNETLDKSTGGVSKYYLEISDLIDTKFEHLFYFFITSWNFTPSFEIVCDSGNYYPAYVDFTINLESDRYINNGILDEILKK